MKNLFKNSFKTNIQKEILNFKQKVVIHVSDNYTMHQCYYCEQLFDSKEQLYEHVEVHSDIERNKEITERRKKEKEN